LIKQYIEKYLFVFSIFILLSRENDGGVIFLDEFAPAYELSNSDCFFDFLPLNWLLVRSRQAEIIIVKHLIQGRNVYDEDGGWN